MELDFIISDHAKENFEKRFPELLPRFSNNVESAMRHEIRFSRKNKKLDQDQYKGIRIKQLMKHGYEETNYYTSRNAVFVVVDNIIKTVYPRKNSFFED